MHTPAVSSGQSAGDNGLEYLTDRAYQSRQKHSSLANISILPFSKFKEQASSIPAPSPVRRKPLPETASPRIAAYTSLTSPRMHNGERELTDHTSSLVSAPQLATGLTNVASSSPPTTERGVRDFEQKLDENMASIAHDGTVFHNAHWAGQEADLQRRNAPPVQLTFATPRSLHLDHDTNAGRGLQASITRSASDMSPTRMVLPGAMKPLPQAPDMMLHQEGLLRSTSDMSIGSTQSGSSPVKRKNSPGSKFSSFFGWKSSPRPYGVDSPSTTFSDRSHSPMASVSPSFARLPGFDPATSASKLTPPALDVRRANTDPRAQYFDSPSTPFASLPSANNAHAEELERELREVSSELASSIRREMELEDEIDRCRSEIPAGNSDLTRRTSDYFSDSGASSVRAEGDAKMEELEKSKRKLEQEKAQVRAEYSMKLADELRKRRDLEARTQHLQEELREKQETALEGAGKDDRVRELETSLEDSRRRLSQERQSRDNFEDLLTALRGELEQHRNDRDNLRDEIVPQLKARIEGLEAEAAEVSTLRYENTRMQQVIQSLQGTSRAPEGLGSPRQSRFNPIAEETTDQPASRFQSLGLSRSNSVAKNPSTGTLKRGNSLSRSASLKDRDGRHTAEPQSVDRVKDVEDQRDALHTTLKNLLRRHEVQNREHSKTIQKLIADRESAKNTSPGRSTFARDVTNLKEEITMLRRRADDALEQKWQTESNLGGVKMALDRAEQETRSLRTMMASNDNGPSPQQSRVSSPMSGLGISMIDDEEDTQSMIKVLRRSIRIAETERDAALREAKAYRERARTLQRESSSGNGGRESQTAEQLLESAARMEQLAAQIQANLDANVQLRERLAKAVVQGEREQSSSTARVVEMQSRLKAMEESVLVAQQQSESSFGRHEEMAKQIEASSMSPQLQRLRSISATTTNTGGRSPDPGLFLSKSPKIGSTSSGRAETLFEVSKTAVLERRVRELEAALADADTEMKGVVQRIETSQYEIAELQGERDDATRQMRRLQSDIEIERERAQALMK